MAKMPKNEKKWNIIEFLGNFDLKPTTATKIGASIKNPDSLERRANIKLSNEIKYINPLRDVV
jgi:hypothetical protein